MDRSEVKQLIIELEQLESIKRIFMDEDDIATEIVINVGFGWFGKPKQNSIKVDTILMEDIINILLEQKTKQYNNCLKKEVSK